jgi:hypothetical protein
MSDTVVNSATAFGEALAGLRSAVDREVKHPEVSREIRSQITSVCREARAARIEPERVLVRVKDTLRDSTALSSIDPELRSEVTSSVISLTIASYFADA